MLQCPALRLFYSFLVDFFEADLLVRVVDSPFIENAYLTVGDHHDVGVGRRAAVYHVGGRPGGAVVAATPQGHIHPFGAGGIGKEEQVLTVGRVVEDARLAGGVDQRIVLPRRGPACAAVAAEGNRTVGASVPHVENQASVGELRHGRFVAAQRFATHMPCLPLVVGVDDMGVLLPACTHLYVVAGYDHPSPVGFFGQDDAMAGARGIPSPGGVFHRGGDLLRTCPGEAVIVGPAVEHPAGVGAGAGIDGPDVVLSQVPGHEQVYSPGFGIDHRTGVAAGVASIVPYHDEGAPRLAIVDRAPQHQIDIALILTVSFPALGEGQQRVLLRATDGRYAEAAVALRGRAEDIGSRDGCLFRVRIRTGLVDGWCLGRARREEHQPDEEEHG